MASTPTPEPTLAPHVTRIQVDGLDLLAEVEADLAEGRRIELARGGKVIAELRAPELATSRVTAANFDFAAQLKEMWGDRVFDVDTTRWIREDRDGE